MLDFQDIQLFVLVGLPLACVLHSAVCIGIGIGSL